MTTEELTVDKNCCPSLEPMADGLTDQELLAVASTLPLNPDDDDILLVLRTAIAADRARRHHQPVPPAAGELVAAVQAAYSAYGWVEKQQFVRLFNEVARLASVVEEGCDCSIEGPMNWKAEIELLRQRYPAPVPERERLPGPEDCNGRDPECVKRWLDCFDGGYDPSCCRFPKSCSCGPRALPLPAEGSIDG